MLTEISIVWGADDVIATADNMDMDIKLSDAEISDVLSLMKSEHDATIGINWDVIEYHIRTVIDERE
jgi:hypothetical protein